MRQSLLNLLFRAPRSSFRLLSGLVAAAVVGCPIPAYSHGDLHERIVALSAELEKDPRNANLLFQRGELHRFHEEWNEALADYTTAQRLDAKMIGTQLATARIFLATGRLPEAKTAIDHYLSFQPGNSEAYIVRARIQVKSRQYLAAADDLSQAIARTTAPFPEYYVERASLFAAAGKIPSALQGLDEGMTCLGPIPTLQMPAVDYERQRGDFPAALLRVDRLIALNTVKEPWLALRAEVLEQAGRSREARDTFNEALAGIEQYQPTRRKRELTRQLETKIRDGIARSEARLLQASTK